VQGEEKLNLVAFGLTNSKVLDNVSKKTAFNLKMKNDQFIVPVISIL